MTKILAFAGSLRKDSFNKALLHAAKELLPSNSTLEITSIKDIPLYNEDVENNEGIPKAVTTLKEKIMKSDALLIATPEYNNSIPGVLKNALDWLTRPPADIKKVFAYRPFGLIGASLGQFGTEHAQVAWLPIIRTLNLTPYFKTKLLVSSANKVFDEDCKIKDEAIRKRLKTYIENFCEFAKMK